MPFSVGFYQMSFFYWVLCKFTMLADVIFYGSFASLPCLLMSISMEFLQHFPLEAGQCYSSLLLISHWKQDNATATNAKFLTSSYFEDNPYLIVTVCVNWHWCFCVDCLSCYFAGYLLICLLLALHWQLISFVRTAIGARGRAHFEGGG